MGSSSACVGALRQVRELLSKATCSTDVGTRMLFENRLCRVWDFYLEADPTDVVDDATIHHHCTCGKCPGPNARCTPRGQWHGSAPLPRRGKPSRWVTWWRPSPTPCDANQHTAARLCGWLRRPRLRVCQRGTQPAPWLQRGSRHAGLRRRAAALRASRSPLALSGLAPQTLTPRRRRPSATSPCGHGGHARFTHAHPSLPRRQPTRTYTRTRARARTHAHAHAHTHAHTAPPPPPPHVHATSAPLVSLHHRHRTSTLLLACGG